jgi:uncharacterized protein YlaI
MPPPKDPERYKEYCRKISEANKNRIYKKGWHHSENTKKKQSERAQQRPPMLETTKEKLRITSTGKKHKPESIEKMRQVQKGHPGYAKGYKHTQEVINQIIERNKKRKGTHYKNIGDKNAAWKGNDANKDTIHQWFKIHNIIPKNCLFCDKERKLDFANITNHNYSRNPEDYIYICRSCHKHFDFLNRKRVFNLHIYE